MIAESKRLEGLRAAYMLDNGEYKVASVVLDFLVKESYGPDERDTELLALSLCGILKKGSIN